MSVYQLLESVARSLRPSKDVFQALEEVTSEVNKQLSLREIDAQAAAGGSVAKNTFLRSSHDVDVFVRFSRGYEDQGLSDLLAPALRSFAPKRVHGSRDYFLFEHRGFVFEVVPVLAISDASQARNVTDASPLHVEYFTRRGEGLEDEVRLAKQFCKAAGVYGAESYIRGFSGHVIDLLVIHYESFYELVRAAAGWSKPVVIDLENHHSNPLLAINPSKHAPLVLVDPIQSSRNAAAAISDEQFDAFVAYCQEFVQAPSKDFFVIEEFSWSRIRSSLAEQPGHSLLLEVTHPAGDKQDVAGSRVRKFFEQLRARLQEAGFVLVDSGWEFLFEESSAVWFVFEEAQLSEEVERRGPPVSEQVHAKRFREEHGEVSERDGVLYAQVKRVFRTPEELVEVVGARICEQAEVSFRLVDGTPAN